jgi:hypothetical protein
LIVKWARQPARRRGFRLQPRGARKSSGLTDKSERVLRLRKELGTFILLVVLCVIVAAINPRFLGGAV